MNDLPTTLLIYVIIEISKVISDCISDVHTNDDNNTVKK